MAKQLEGLGVIELKALAAMVGDAVAKEASSKIPVGPHVVDFMVQIKGLLVKGADYEGEIVAKADPWLLLAVALSHLNGKTVDSIVKEALSADPALADSLKVQAQKALEAVKGPTKTNCNGKVTCKLSAAKVV
jgi:hypothetical protein